MIVNKKLNSHNSIIAVISMIESINLPVIDNHLLVLDWMLQCNIGGIYTSLNGNRSRCTYKHKLSVAQYSKAVKRLLASKIIKEVGKGSNKTCPSYQIHADIVLIYSAKNSIIQIGFK